MQYIKSNDGTKIAVYDYNPKGKQTIFLIHGWPLSHKIYEYQINLLTDCGFRVVAVDLRGFGKSDTPVFGYTYNQMSADIFNVVQKLKLRNFILSGFSMGGAIALRYMNIYKGFGVNKLILLSAAAPCFTQRPDFPYGKTVQEVNSLINLAETDRPQLCLNFSRQLFASPHSEAVIDWFRDIALSASGIGTIKCDIALRDEDGRKVYVEVTAKFDIDGNITPLSVTWEDGTIYEIDKVVDKRRAASLKAGGIGVRYTCRILGQESYLFYENPKWFVEAKR